MMAALARKPVKIPVCPNYQFPPTIPTAFDLKCEKLQLENILGAWWGTESTSSILHIISLIYQGLFALTGLNWPLWEAFLNVFLQPTLFTHLIHWARSIYSVHLALFLIQINDWSCRLQVGLDSAMKKNMACYRGQMTQGTPSRHKLGQKHLCRYPPVS